MKVRLVDSKTGMSIWCGETTNLSISSDCLEMVWVEEDVLVMRVIQPTEILPLEKVLITKAG